MEEPAWALFGRDLATPEGVAEDVDSGIDSSGIFLFRY
jgi:hypothetical protein